MFRLKLLLVAKPRARMAKTKHMLNLSYLISNIEIQKQLLSFPNLNTWPEIHCSP